MALYATVNNVALIAFSTKFYGSETYPGKEQETLIILNFQILWGQLKFVLFFLILKGCLAEPSFKKLMLA